MNIKEVRSKFDRIDAAVSVDKSVDGFSPEFVKGIGKILGGDLVD